jgi:cytochrome c553
MSSLHHLAVLCVSSILGALAACGGTSTSSITGSGDGGGSDGGTDDASVYDTPVTCTSNVKWTRGDRGSQLMHPGRACIQCHTDNGGPPLSIAGTVYPTAHEPDDCNGVAGKVTVVITDAKGKVTNISVNSAGNFYSIASIAKPFSAKVVDANGERAMDDKQTSGDCNSCHTQDGANNAPGRIMAP